MIFAYICIYMYGWFFILIFIFFFVFALCSLFLVPRFLRFRRCRSLVVALRLLVSNSKLSDVHYFSADERSLRELLTTVDFWIFFSTETRALVGFAAYRALVSRPLRNLFKACFQKNSGV